MGWEFDLKDEPVTEEPAAPVATEPTDQHVEPETKEPVASVTTDVTDLQAEPET